MGKALDEYQVRRASSELLRAARIGNKYFNDSAPWLTIKQDRRRCATTLYTAVQLLLALAVLMEPIMPFSAEKLWRMLNTPGSLREQRWREIPSLRLPEGHALGARDILFHKIDDKAIQAQVERLHSGTRN
jgi:methionyl-tRNA synthetase